MIYRHAFIASKLAYKSYDENHEGRQRQLFNHFWFYVWELLQMNMLPTAALSFGLMLSFYILQWAWWQFLSQLFPKDTPLIFSYYSKEGLTDEFSSK